MASRRVTWLGIVIALAGVVIGIWLLVLEGGTYPFGSTIGAKVTTEARLQDVSLGLTMIGAGALLAGAAQIMGMTQAAAQRQASNGPKACGPVHARGPGAQRQVVACRCGGALDDVRADAVQSL